MSRLKAGCLVALVGVLLALTAYQVRRTLKDPRCDTNYIYAADLLQPASIYQDIVVDGYSLKTYQLSGANFLVPDQCLYFVLRYALGSTPAAVQVWTLLIFPLVTLAAVVAARSVASPAERGLTTGLVLCTAALLTVHCSRDFFSKAAEREVFLPVFHNGAVFCMFLGLALAVRSLWGSSRLAFAGSLIGLAFIGASTVASDRLFASWFIAPAVVTIPVARLLMRGGPSWKRVLTTTLVIGAAGAAGLMLAKWMHGSDDAIQNYWTESQLVGLTKRLNHLRRCFLNACQDGNLLTISATAWFYVSAVVVPRAAWQRFRSTREPVTTNPRLVLYCLFSMAMTLGNATVFLLSHSSVETLGKHPWEVISRYFTGPQMIALFGWPILLAQPWPTLGRWRWSPAALPIAMLAGLLTVALSEKREPVRDAFDDYPETVRRLDEECARRGLTDGVGDYEAAKRLTLLSRRGVRVRQIGYDRHAPCGFAAFHWLSNAAWHWQPPRSNPTPINYEFILVHPTPTNPQEPTPAEIERTFGPAVEQVHLGEYVMLVYNRQSDVLRSAVLEHDCVALNLRFRFTDMPRVRYPGGALYGPKWFSSFHRERTASEGEHPAGLIACGPYLTPPGPGRYRVLFCTSSTGVDASNGHVDVLINWPGAITESVAEKELLPSGHQLTELVIDVTPEMLKGKLEFRTFFSGQGTLTLHWVEVERVK